MSKIKSLFQSEIFFLVPFGIWVFFSIFRTTLLFSYINPFYVPISLVCMSLIVIHELSYLKEYGWKDYLGALIALFMFVIQFLLKDGTVMYSILCVFVSRHTSLKRIMVLLLFTVSAAFTITIISSQVGLINDYVFETQYRTRHYLGFIYTLVPPSMFLNICAIYMFLRNKRVFLIEPIFLSLIAFILFRLTLSRLAFIATVIVLFFGYFMKFINNKSFIKKCFTAIFIGMIVIAPISNFYVTYIYNPNNEIHLKIDRVFGYRFYYGKMAIEKYGIQPWINDIKFHGNGLGTNGESDSGDQKYDYVDSFYIHNTLRCGSIFMSLFMFLYISSSIQVARHKNIYILFFLMIFALNGIITDMLFALYYNAFLIVLGRTFKNRDDSLYLD